MPRLTRADQAWLLPRMRWYWKLGWSGRSWKSNTAAFPAVCSSVVSFARPRMKVSAMNAGMVGRSCGAARAFVDPMVCSGRGAWRLVDQAMRKL